MGPLTDVPKYTEYRMIEQTDYTETQLLKPYSCVGDTAVLDTLSPPTPFSQLPTAGLGNSVHPAEALTSCSFRGGGMCGLMDLAPVMSSGSVLIASPSRSPSFPCVTPLLPIFLKQMACFGILTSGPASGRTHTDL